jgi:hypothetical protein
MLYLSAIKNLKDKDLMVLTILNLTLVPSILIFDFGSNILRTQLLQDESKAIKAIRKHLMNKILPSLSN